MIPKLIVMLTYNDKTVPNAFDVFETSKTARAENWGFKDIGLPPDQMKRVVNRMKDAGKTTYLEVVRYSEKECCESASLAVECGFDYLMGTVFYKSVSSFLREKSIKYLPFCGQVSGSPSILEGSIREIVEDAKRIASYG